MGSFYTSRKFGLEIWVFLKGDAQAASNHVSIFIHTINKSFDDVVQWPLKANIEFSVLSKSVKHFARSFKTTTQSDAPFFDKPLLDNHNDTARGFPKFVQLNKISSLIENDTFSIKVGVNYH